MNALWVWRNRNCSVSFWWELLYWMNNLCNCCLLLCRAWILPDRCVWRAVSVCSDCTNTSVVHPLLNLVSSQIVIPASFVFPIAGWVQAECLGRAGLDPLLYTQPLSGPEIALLCPHSWHFHFTDITLCLHWPKMPTYALATRQLSSSLAIQLVFLYRNNWGHMILIQRRICSISLLWFRHLRGKKKKACDPRRRYPWRHVRLEFG